jgi:hypothetical protein
MFWGRVSRRIRLRVASRARCSSAGCRADCQLRVWHAPRYFDVASRPNKRMHATRDPQVVIKLNHAGGRVMRGVMRRSREKG